MDLYEVMRTTAAIRESTDDPRPDDVLHTILENARFARVEATAREPTSS